MVTEKRDWSIFLSSVFFVLGFAVIFSVVGVLLQGVLSTVSFDVQQWLGRIGGTLIIIFGLYLLTLIRIPFLEREHKFRVKQFRSKYLTSFIFGAAFAVGWTPCVGAILGAILSLAVTQPTSAFFLLLSYTVGLGIPFLLVGLFTNQAQTFINRHQQGFKYLDYIFGAVLIILGILVFTQELPKIANLQFVANFLIALNVQSINFMTLNLGIAFIAGFISFLSPCILPLIPAFLAYLASVGVKSR